MRASVSVRRRTHANPTPSDAGGSGSRLGRRRVSAGIAAPCQRPRVGAGPCRGHQRRAHALAGLAERYRKLAGRDDARRNALTPDTAPLQLVVDILMDEDLPNRRLARDPDKDPDPVAVPYHRRRQRLSRMNEEFNHAQVSRRCACDRRIAALEAQLAAAGLTPVEENDRARRIRLGQDMHISPGGKVVSTEDWERSMDDDG